MPRKITISKRLALQIHRSVSNPKPSQRQRTGALDYGVRADKDEVPFEQYERLRKSVAYNMWQFCEKLGYWGGSYCNWRDHGRVPGRAWRRAVAFVQHDGQRVTRRKRTIKVTLFANNRHEARWLVERGLAHDRFWRNLGAEVRA